MTVFSEVPQSWTPTASNETNITIDSFGVNMYWQVSNIVYCSGAINITGSSPSCNFNLSLPVSATFSGANDAIGVGCINNGTSRNVILYRNVVTIRGDSTNNLLFFDLDLDTSDTTTLRYEAIYRR